MKALRFTKGMAAASRRPRRSPDGRTSDGGSEGTAQADPGSKSWLSRQGLRVEMRRWRKGLAGAFVIRWHIWPSGPRRE